MNQPLSQLDPKWAWQPYEPSAERPWTVKQAAHLYRRAGFSASWQTLQDAVKKKPAEVVHELIYESQDSAQLADELDQLGEALLAGGSAEQLSAWWLYRMLRSNQQLSEKMTLFWHGHFATSAAKVEEAELMFNQNQLFRKESLGDFAALVQAVSKDPAMLIYLDSESNRKRHPNENYAREVMELFCLGEGQYSENDIRELAKCFTGWEVRLGKFRFNRYQHDFGEKKILGKRGKFTGEEGVSIVLEQLAAPRFIVAKLLRYFVFDEPAAPSHLIAPLAELFRAKELQVAPLLETILGSNLFFSEHALAKKVRSPVEMAVGLLRSLKASTNVVELAEGLQQLDQQLFYPPNVKGWDGGRAWINASTLLARANFVEQLLYNPKTRFDGKTPAKMLATDGIDKDSLVNWIDNALLAVPLSAPVRADINRLLEGNSLDSGFRKAVHAVSGLAQFHLA